MKRIGFLLVFALCCSCVSGFAAAPVEEHLLGRLWSYTESTAQKGTVDLSAALGLSPFEGSVTGLADQRAYVRGESGLLVAEFGAAAHVPALKAAASAETDLQARETLYLAAARLELKSCAAKPAFITAFLYDCTRAGAFGPLGVPRSALRYVMVEAQNFGVAEAKAHLTTLKKTLFAEDERMILEINGTIKAIDFYLAQKSLGLQGMCEAGLFNSDPFVQEWALRRLTAENTIERLSAANNILVTLLSRQNVRTTELKERMETIGMLRAQNPNAAFESGTEGAPVNWTVTKGAAAATLFFPDRGAYSYQSCITVNNPDATQTRLTNRLYYFSALMPYAIEYGCRIKVAAAESGSYVAMRAKLVYADGTAETKATAVALEGGTGWLPLQASVRAAKAIYAVQAELAVGGKATVSFDDAFVRYAPESFNNLPPVITAIAISQAAAFASGSDALTFSATVTDPERKTVKGAWFSDLQGKLGEGLSLTVALIVPGKHRITFEASDPFGAKAIATKTIDCYKPLVALSAYPALNWQAPLSAAQGQVSLRIVVSGLADPALGTLSYSHTLYFNNVALATFTGNQYALNPAYLSEGFGSLKVYTRIMRGSSGSVRCAVYSEPVYVQVANGAASKAPIMATPKHTSYNYVPFSAGVTFAGSAGYPQKVSYFMVYSGSLCEVGSSTVSPSYTASLVPPKYYFPNGTYQLFAAARYLQPDGSTLTAYSSPIVVTISQATTTAATY